jgi:Mn-containing catalase
LLNGVNGELKDAADQSEIMQLMKSKVAKENISPLALTANPQFPMITYV